MTHCRPLIHLYLPNGEMYKPTISKTPGFSPTADSEHLKKAMRGMGTNEREIINILGSRTSAERLAIRDAYLSNSKQSLQEALHSDLSCHFRKLALMLIMSPWQVMAKALYKAMKGLGTKERVLNEIIAGCSKEDIPELKKAFEEVSGGRTLEDYIKGDTSGSYKDALLLALSGQTDEPESMQLKNLSSATLCEVVNLSLAETDAKEIRARGEGRMGTAEDRFMRPIINRSFLQLGATNDAYNRLYGHSLVDAIKHETSRDFCDFLITRVRYAVDRAALFAELLHFAMRGAGTKDSTLQRTLVLRSDIDLEDVKVKYAELYGKTLEAAIKGDTTGDYEDLCVKMLGST